MQFKIFIFSLLLLSQLFSQEDWKGTKLLYVESEFQSEQIVQHRAYNLQYSEVHEQARWVSYILNDLRAMGSYERSDNFRNDPLVISGSAPLSAYKGSGYDRGHLAPAGDMSWSSQSMSESFFMSNMSPQEPSFNRGIWKKLESDVRSAAITNVEIYVVTGPIFSDNLGSIGDNVSVPGYYYKVLLDYTDPEIKGIGFILQNKKLEGSLEAFSCTINIVEEKTGLDFFSSLPDSLENLLESQMDFDAWGFDNSKSSSSEKKLSTSVQCKGKTQKGYRCKRKTKNENEFCYQHQEQVGTTPSYKSPTKSSSSSPYSGRCQATTKKGKQCKRNASSGSRYCWQHK